MIAPEAVALHGLQPRRPVRNRAKAEGLLHTIARLLGELARDDGMSYGRAAAELDADASRYAYNQSLTDAEHGKLRDALFETLEAAVDVEDRDAIAAGRDIRAGLQPLLTRRAPMAELRQAAYRIADARLLRAECQRIIRELVAQHLQRPVAA